MAIKIGGIDNPTAVKYNDGLSTIDLTEVWYKSSPNATAVKVWPENITVDIGGYSNVTISPIGDIESITPIYGGEYTRYSWNPDKTIEIEFRSYPNTSIGLWYTTSTGGTVQLEFTTTVNKVYLTWDGKAHKWYSGIEGNKKHNTVPGNGEIKETWSNVGSGVHVQAYAKRQPH